MHDCGMGGEGCFHAASLEVGEGLGAWADTFVGAGMGGWKEKVVVDARRMCDSGMDCLLWDDWGD